MFYSDEDSSHRVGWTDCRWKGSSKSPLTRPLPAGLTGKGQSLYSCPGLCLPEKFSLHSGAIPVYGGYIVLVHKQRKAALATAICLFKDLFQWKQWSFNSYGFLKEWSPPLAKASASRQCFSELQKLYDLVYGSTPALTSFLKALWQSGRLKQRFWQKIST